MKRFYKCVLQIIRSDETIMVFTFKQGLRKGDNLLKALVKSQPKTLHEMFQKVNKYLNLKEVMGKEENKR